MTALDPLPLPLDVGLSAKLFDKREGEEHEVETNNAMEHKGLRRQRVCECLDPQISSRFEKRC